MLSKTPAPYRSSSIYPERANGQGNMLLQPIVGKGDVNYLDQAFATRFSNLSFMYPASAPHSSDCLAIHLSAMVMRTKGRTSLPLIALYSHCWSPPISISLLCAVRSKKPPSCQQDDRANILCPLRRIRAGHNAASDPIKIPGCVMATVGKNWKPIFTHASGKCGVDTKEPMTTDSMFWIAR